MELDIISELEGLVDALAAAAIPYAVCGGLALGILGHPRMTKDIDLLVRPEDVSRIVSIATQRGFDVPSRRMVFRSGRPDQHEMQRVSMLDPATNNLLSLDLIFVGAGYQQVWDGRIELPRRNGTIWVVSRAGLATMKRLAGRPQDLVDIARLEGNDDGEET